MGNAPRIRHHVRHLTCNCGVYLVLRKSSIIVDEIPLCPDAECCIVRSDWFRRQQHGHHFGEAQCDHHLQKPGCRTPPSSNGGMLHCPLSVCPQANTRPSLRRRATNGRPKLAETWAYKTPSSNDGNSI